MERTSLYKHIIGMLSRGILEEYPLPYVKESCHKCIMGTPVKKSLATFGKSFAKHWFTLMSGGLSVPLTIVATFLDNKVAQLGLGLLAIICFVSASYFVWRRERDTISDLQNKENSVEKRLTIKATLGILLEQASTLIIECKNSSMDKEVLFANAKVWNDKTKKFILESLGSGEVHYFIHGGDTLVYSDPGQPHENLRVELDHLSKRLTKILNRVDSISVEPYFEGS